MPTPAETRNAILRDLKPTRPLRTPWVRALGLLPIAAAVVVSVPALRFFRPDMAAIGFLRAWGFSIGQAIAGLVIIAAAFRESIPGRGYSRVAIAGIAAGGLALPGVLLALTARAYNLGPGPGEAFADGVGCFRASATAALPALLVAAFLAARAFPVRPVIAGAFYGLGCGLIADAGLRLYCDYSEPLHVLFAHGGAVVTSMLAGSAVAIAAARGPFRPRS